jgi:hypothetical protein
VQVHNYSLVDSSSVPAEFYAVPVDARGIDVTGAPQPIGTVSSLPIPSQGVVTVNSPSWAAKGPPSGDGAQAWRIFVVLDSANTLKEIHPWKDGTTCPTDALDPEAPAGTVVDGKMVDPMTGQPDTLACGQNNQGYGNVTVLPKASALTNANGLSLASSEATGVRLAGSGLVAGKTGDQPLVAAGTPSIQLGEDVIGLVYTSATADSSSIQPVLIYDGPASDGSLIAATTQAGATRADGGNAQFTWRPATAGLHTIHEVLLGSDPADNSEQTMDVNVLATASAAATPTATRAPDATGSATPSTTPTPTTACSATPTTAPAPDATGSATPSTTPTPTTACSATPTTTPTPGATGSATPTTTRTSTAVAKATPSTTPTPTTTGSATPTGTSPPATPARGG